MRRNLTFLLLLLSCSAMSQPASHEIRITVQSTAKTALPHSTVSLLKPDSTLVRTNITNSAGLVVFTDLAGANYLVRVTRIGHREQYLNIIDLPLPFTFMVNQSEAAITPPLRYFIVPTSVCALMCSPNMTSTFGFSSTPSLIIRGSPAIYLERGANAYVQAGVLNNA